jgi:hypothetical protein
LVIQRLMRRLKNGSSGIRYYAELPVMLISPQASSRTCCMMCFFNLDHDIFMTLTNHKWQCIKIFLSTLQSLLLNKYVHICILHLLTYRYFYIAKNNEQMLDMKDKLFSYCGLLGSDTCNLCMWVPP